MNEATFEGFLNNTLDKIFVGPVRPRIEHQKVLTLRVGHQQVVVNGNFKSEARGRLDVLLILDATNLAILELKSPELELDKDDEDQAWSYARLLHPMPPFYIVSNGKECRIFRTYDRSRVEGTTLEEKAIIDRMSEATAAAAEGERIAIHCLLGKSPEFFRDILERISHKQLMNVMGTVDDFSKPVCHAFGINREVTLALYQALLSKLSSVYTLYGDAISGKTNVLADLCYISYKGPVDRAIAPLYLNCEYLEHGILQTLANELSRETNVLIDVNDVRQWIRTNTMSVAGAKPVILLDSWSPSVTDDLRSELSELLDIITPEAFSIIVAIDSAHSEQLLKTSRRGQDTKLGANSVKIQVPSTLSNYEMQSAANSVYLLNRLKPENGVQHNTLFRLPSTWRMLASCKPTEGGLIPATLGAEQLHNIQVNLPLTAEQTEDIHAYCRAILDDDGKRLHGVLKASSGWISLQYARNKLGEKILKRLIACGFLSSRLTREKLPVVAPQMPLLLAAHAVTVLQERLKSQIGDVPIKQAIEDLLEGCRRFPYCELVGATAVIDGNLALNEANEVVSQLLEMEPEITEVPVDAKFTILVEGREPIELSPDFIREILEDGGRYTYGDLVPYLIVSHVMRWVAVVDGKVPEWAMRVIERLACVKIPMYAADFASEVRLRHAEPLASYELIGGGSILSSENGVIEPITDTLRHMALNASDDFSKLVNTLMSQDKPNIAFLNRMFTAAEIVGFLISPVAEMAKGWTASLSRKLQERRHEEIVHSKFVDDA